MEAEVRKDELGERRGLESATTPPCPTAACNTISAFLKWVKANIGVNMSTISNSCIT